MEWWVELPAASYSVSDIQVYIGYFIKQYKTSRANPPIHVSINIVNKRLVFKIKDEYMWELQTPEAMKIFGSTKKVNRQKNWRKYDKSFNSWN